MSRMTSTGLRGSLSRRSRRGRSAGWTWGCCMALRPTARGCVVSWARSMIATTITRRSSASGSAHSRRGVHCHAITYSARHETDGMVTTEWIQERFDIARAKPKERTEAMAALVELGLFEPVDGERFRVHDYLDYNPSAADLQAKREADAARKRKGKSVWSPRGFQRDSERQRWICPFGVRASRGRCPGPARPGPSRNYRGTGLVESLQTFMASEAVCETDFFGVSG
jgi:hypothetical protein